MALPVFGNRLPQPRATRAASYGTTGVNLARNLMNRRRGVVNRPGQMYPIPGANPGGVSRAFNPPSRAQLFNREQSRPDFRQAVNAQERDMLRGRQNPPRVLQAQQRENLPPGVRPTKPSLSELPQNAYRRLNALRALTHGYHPTVKGNPEVANYRDLSRQEQIAKRKFLRDLLSQTWKGDLTRHARGMNYNPTYRPPRGPQR